MNLLPLYNYENSDAYTFFSSAKESNFSLIKTGATGTNVADVCVVLVLKDFGCSLDYIL